MKATIIGSRKEGFLSSIGIELENGLRLETTVDLAWCGLTRKAEVIQQFSQYLRDSNLELTNSERLKEIEDDLD